MSAAASGIEGHVAHLFDDGAAMSLEESGIGQGGYGSLECESAKTCFAPNR